MLKSFTVCLSIFITGCAIAPEPISPQEQQQLLEIDRQKTFENVEPVSGKVTLAEAIARGLKYNLEYRTKRLEQAIAVGILDVSKYDMLPGLVANAGYNYRNNYFITTATGAYSGNPSLNEPFVSSAKDYGVAGLALNWSLLDFGVSYYTAKQNADRILVAAERRRRTMHLLIQDVQSVYLRAASAQKLQSEISETIASAERAIRRAKADVADGLKDPIDVLRYQKSLLDNVRLLQTINQQLSTASIELNQLINLPAGTRYQLEDPDKISPPSAYEQTPVEDFELRALLNNGDLKESIYNTRIALQETRKSILQLLPGVTFTYGPQVSNNSFYINKNWVEGAAQISFNFWNLLMAPQVKQNAEANEELAQQRRMMVQMAVVGQVHIAKQQLAFSDYIYQKSAEIDQIDRQIARVTNQRLIEGRASEAEQVAANTASILSQLRKYEALAEMYAASGRLQATAGLEPDAGNVDSVPLSELSEAVRETLAVWTSGQLPPLNMLEQQELVLDRIVSVVSKKE